MDGYKTMILLNFMVFYEFEKSLNPNKARINYLRKEGYIQRMMTHAECDQGHWKDDDDV